MELLTELAKQIPNAVAVIVMAYLFLQHEKQSEDRRIENDKTLETERRTHELQINNMWAGYIKQLVEQQNQAFTSIAKTISEHEEASQARYERMEITDELIKAVKAQATQKKQ